VVRGAMAQDEATGPCHHDHESTCQITFRPQNIGFALAHNAALANEIFSSIDGLLGSSSSLEGHC